jgi:hypothetical protein
MFDVGPIVSYVARIFPGLGAFIANLGRPLAPVPFDLEIAEVVGPPFVQPDQRSSLPYEKAWYPVISRPTTSERTLSVPS